MRSNQSLKKKIICKVIEMLLWIFSFTVGANTNTKVIFDVGPIHHYRSLPNPSLPSKCEKGPLRLENEGT